MNDLTFWEWLPLFVLFCLLMWYAAQLIYIPIAIHKASDSLERIANSLEKIASREGVKIDE